MPGFKKKESERHSPYTAKWMDVYEERVLKYFRNKCRNTGRSLLTFQEVATDLEVNCATAKRYIRRLCDTGRLKRERHKDLGGIFEVPGLKARSASKKTSLQPWDLDSTKAVFEELRRKCAAADGKWSGTHQMLADGVKLHPGTTISRITRELQARGLITKDRHGNWSDYTIVGEAVTTKRPSPLSAEGKMLKFFEDECARTGIIASAQTVIAKGTGLHQKIISTNTGKLDRDGYIKIVRLGRPCLISVPGITGAFPGEPPVFSLEETLLRFLRDQARGGTCTLSFSSIARSLGWKRDTVRSRLANLIENGLVLETQRGAHTNSPSTYAVAAQSANKRPWTQPGIQLVPAPEAFDVSRTKTSGRKTADINAASVKYWMKDRRKVLDMAFAEKVAQDVCPKELAKFKLYSDERSNFLAAINAGIRRSAQYKAVHPPNRRRRITSVLS